MTVHPLRRPAPRPSRVPATTAAGPAPTAAPVLPAQRTAPTTSLPAAVLDALGAPAPDRQGAPAARVPVTLLLSLAGRCACAECVSAYTQDVRRSRLRAVSA